MACRLFGTKPLSEPIWVFVNITFGTNLNETWLKYSKFYERKINLEIETAAWRPFCLILSVLIWSIPDTVKPVCNDHIFNKIYYLWFIR